MSIADCIESIKAITTSHEQMVRQLCVLSKFIPCPTIQNSILLTKQIIENLEKEIEIYKNIVDVYKKEERIYYVVKLKSENCGTYWIGYSSNLDKANEFHKIIVEKYKHEAMWEIVIDKINSKDMTLDELGYLDR